MPSKNVVYVYPDVVFAISSIMNFIILWGTNRLARLNSSKVRLGVGAVIGALYSAAAAYPHFYYLHFFGVKMLFGTVMFLTAFFPLPFKRFLSGFLYFFLVSFSVGGIFFGVIFLINSLAWGAQIQKGILNVINHYFFAGFGTTLVLYYAVMRWGLPLFRKRGLHGVLKVPVKVLFNNRQIEVEALLDTGNQLQDPITMTPVVVVEYTALSSCLPRELKSFFESEETDLTTITSILSDKFWSTRFRLIPFTSLGKSNGMLVGFRPDQIEVRKGEVVFTKTDVIIGIYNKNLSPEGNYKALLHPDLLQEISA